MSAAVSPLLDVSVYFTPYRYYKRADAQKAMCYINRTKLDDRIIRTDWDAGFVEGRQFGRGRTGGQVCVCLYVCACICVVR